MRRTLSSLFDALASFWLAITVLAFLFVLTILGTLEQTRSSLYEVQKRYFESAFVMHPITKDISVPLPGVYLLLVVLAVNLVCGGIVRIRKDRSTWGILVTHLGIIAMLAGAAVEFTYSQKGHATVPEGGQTTEFQSYNDWEIAIADASGAGPVTEYVIPGEKFMDLAVGRRATFTSPALPFEVTVHDPLANCEPRPAPAGSVLAADGLALAPLPRNLEAERDLAGANVTVTPRNGAAVEGIVWAGERFPLSVVVDGRRSTIALSHRRWQLPFSIRLDKFHKEMHPGLSMAKAFESDVTKVEGGVAQKVKISMNQPLRRSGFTFYQSGFQEPSAAGGGAWWSTFSVVRNPADDVPLVACIVITAGLLLHFSQKLLRHVRAQTWRRN